MERFQLRAPFRPAGDQPRAIAAVTRGLREGLRHQVLLGTTGSGKTYTMSNILANLNRPTLVISPNKVLAAQLYAEFKAFFPKNAVEYFISYYDYYQPEAYVPQTDTYIEKDASINDRIDRLRLKATCSLLSRRDVIVVASVSCIYNIGSPENYKEQCILLEAGKKKDRTRLLQDLVNIYYERNEVGFARGKFRAKGGAVDVFPAYSETALRIQLGEEVIEAIEEFRPLTGEKISLLPRVWIYPAKHFVTTRPELEAALRAMEVEMRDRVCWFQKKGKNLEAQRLLQRTRYDMEMMRELGFCHGIENYSRHLSGRKPGERPFCLIDYFPSDFMLFVDESHVSIPQVRGMYEGDRSRKQTLVDYGFRLPSALDNRPLKFHEFESLTRQILYVSATPGPYELQKSREAWRQKASADGSPRTCVRESAGAASYGEKPWIAEQVIRPTGLVDPEVELHPTQGQVPHLIAKIQERVKRNERILVTTLTKKTAEDLAAYLTGQGLRVRYLHSDIESLTRIQILKELRQGKFDVLVGINLLREGLDLPEVALVAILDADKEGFLRSETTLIQICGRAARNVNGRIILYADQMTGSMRRAIQEMERRRKKQTAHNQKHKIAPKSIQKAVEELEEFQQEAKRRGLSILRDAASGPPDPSRLPQIMESLEKQMREAADLLDFELAAVLRDQWLELKEMGGVRRWT